MNTIYLYCAKYYKRLSSVHKNKRSANILNKP